jgi:predicted dehydrogenase
MSDPIGIGVIGLGESGQHHLDVIHGDRVRPQAPSVAAKTTLFQTGKQFAKSVLGRERPAPTPVSNPDHPAMDNLKVVAISDVDEGRLTEAKERFGVSNAWTDYKRLLAREDVQAVLISTPPMFHREITIEAARHGKHILCEKPMALSSAGCLEMLDAVQKAGVVLQIGYMLRFSSERGRIAEVIRNNQIGRPVFYREMISLRAGGDQMWIHDQNLGGGPLWEVSHGIDFLRSVFGDPETVFGIGGRYKPNKTSAIDTYAASLMFRSGDKALIGDSYALKNFGWDNEACRKHRTEIDVIGPGGYMQFPDADLSNRLTICAYSEPDDRIEKIRWTSVWGAAEDGYRKQLEHFVECIKEGKTPIVSGVEGFKTVQLAEAIMESIRTGETRKLTSSNEPLG